MRHVGTVTLKTERLVLRRAELSDAPAMFANWTGDDEVTKYLTWPTHASVAATEGFIKYLLGEYENVKSYSWVIALKGMDAQPIGMISVVNMNEETDAVEIGYCLSRSWWGRGVMTEALGEVIDFCFETLGAQRVAARHDTNNPASGAVMRKCGMTHEGTLRRADKNNQGICDAAYYSILREEYRK